MTDPLTTLTAAGVSIWLDDLSRDRLTSGSLAGLVANDHVVGVTTNPTIFARAITGGHGYDSQVRGLAARGVGAGEALRALTTHDVRWGCDVLRPVHDATAGVDGRVSIEVDPRLAHDTEATIAEAEALWWTAFHDRVGGVVLRLPCGHRDRRPAGRHGQPEGGGAARPGGDRQRPAGLPTPRTGVLLTAVGAAAGRGRASATATVGVDGRQGPAVSRHPLRRRPRGPGVVNTMPEATLRAVADHGRIPADSIHDHYGDAQRTLEDLRALGVDYDKVVHTPRGRRTRPSTAAGTNSVTR
jgi:transaldolase